MCSITFLLLVFYIFSKELDYLDTSDKYGDLFCVLLDLVVSPKDRPSHPASTPWEGYARKSLSPEILFMNEDEQNDIMASFTKGNKNILDGMNLNYSIDVE